MLYDELTQSNNYICHHGVKGQRWGVRRYQNADGTLTKAGRKRFGRYGTKIINKIESAKKETGLSYDKVGRQIINDEVTKERKITNPKGLITLGGAAVGALGAGVLGMSTGGVGFMAAPALIMGGTMAGALINSGITYHRYERLRDINEAYELPDLTITRSHHGD